MLEKIPGMGRLEEKLRRAGLVTQEEIEETHRRLRTRRRQVFVEFLENAVANYWLNRAIVRCSTEKYDLAVVIGPYPWYDSKERVYWLDDLYVTADNKEQPPLLQNALPFSTHVANQVVACLKRQSKGKGSIKTYPGLYPLEITYSEPWEQDSSREVEYVSVMKAKSPEEAVTEVLNRSWGIYHQRELEHLSIYFDDHWHRVRSAKNEYYRPTHADWHIV